MKKILFFVLSVIFSIASTNIAYAGTTWDKTNIENGYITLTYTGSFDKPIKVYVTRSGSTSYDVLSLTSDKPTNVPIQLGDGSYTVSVMQSISGDTYRRLDSTTFDYKADKDNMDRFLVPNIYIDYNTDMEFFKHYYKAFGAEPSKSKQVKQFFDSVVHEYTYDTAKAKNLPKGYVPVIDKTFLAKKGICSDYSTLVAGYLRSIGVPVKLIMGYNPEVTEYHAWNEIYLDGKWIVVDATYSAAYVRANKGYTIEMDGSKLTVVKVY